MLPLGFEMMEEVYKIIENKKGNYYTLFHGVDGSRLLPINTWLNANKRLVKDGSDGLIYESGFHCFLDLNIAHNYIRHFRKNKNRTIIKCIANNIRQKPTNPNVYLADAIFIPSGDEKKWIQK